ncbi:MAG TPA: hypothetical protein VGM02_11170 [Acidobacteriaceae bacterium]
MKKPNVTRSAAPATKAKPNTRSAKELPVELDRRGKPLPPRQRVGGIITPQ